MSLSDTPNSERVHISFFGCRNAGKSSLVNTFTGQNISIVSNKKGTTTDPVKKAMELLPIGPVLIIDTPGFDDEGILGSMRIDKTNEIIAKTDFAVLVVDITRGKTNKDDELINIFRKKNLPYIVVYNKIDLLNNINIDTQDEIYVSSLNGYNIEKLKLLIGDKIYKYKQQQCEKFIIADKLEKNDIVILVIPIDESAPKGRLILPQQQTIREILNINAVSICIQDDEIESTLKNLKKQPKLVITDSQVFEKVNKIVPNEIPLTSFSILFARYKGDLTSLINGVKQISKLKLGDKILISEGCTHHRQCNDIGSVKIPKWLENYTNYKFDYHYTSGGEFPSDLSEYSLIIHCGGCMLNEQEMRNRITQAMEQNIPIINYGVAIAYMNGILKRSLEIFPEIQNILKD